jgi:hypothetical protein
VFSGVKTRKLNSNPSKATDGSGQSKLNFMKPRPRGGMKTPVVDVRGSITPCDGACDAGAPPIITPAPAAPSSVSQVRRS